MEQKFYICKHCGNIIAKVKDAGVPVVCCGEPMSEIVPSTTDAAVEKHVPVWTVENGIVHVKVGSVEHPMLPEHYIEWVSLQTKQGNQRTVSIQTKMLASTLEVEEIDVLKAVNLYTEALMLLDQYDHQSLNKPEGSKPIYRITYEECRRMVEAMEDTFHSDVFGIEKEEGKVEGILAAVYQSVFGGDVYPSLEEKAANLLYFMIKDHPYADGCKRIAASLFLEFLNKNNFLYKDGTKRISDGAMVAITLMIAESNPSEKDIMVNLVMNLLTI